VSGGATVIVPAWYLAPASGAFCFELIAHQVLRNGWRERKALFARALRVQKVPVHPPDLTKSGNAYSAPNVPGVPSHYLKSGQGTEPWRRFVNADGSISPRAAGGGKYWGPV
jgi:hypothetical protein